MPIVRLTDAAEYLAARDRASGHGPHGLGAYTPGNIRTLTNSGATCFLSLDSKSGFYLMSDTFPRGDFNLAGLPEGWLTEARALQAAKLQ